MGHPGAVTTLWWYAVDPAVAIEEALKQVISNDQQPGANEPGCFRVSKNV